MQINQSVDWDLGWSPGYRAPVHKIMLPLTSGRPHVWEGTWPAYCRQIPPPPPQTFLTVGSASETELTIGSATGTALTVGSASEMQLPHPVCNYCLFVCFWDGGNICFIAKKKNHSYNSYWLFIGLRSSTQVHGKVWILDEYFWRTLNMLFIYPNFFLIYFLFITLKQQRRPPLSSQLHFLVECWSPPPPFNLPPPPLSSSWSKVALVL